MKTEKPICQGKKKIEAASVANREKAGCIHCEIE
jgi:hypothetical protein